jgi:hypothetical protein
LDLVNCVPIEYRGQYAELKLNFKLCKYCKTEKPLDMFPKRKDNHGGYDHRCYSCRKQRTKEVNSLKKYSGPKPLCCEKCGVKPDVDDSKKRGHRMQGLCLDHDPDTGEFRGWLCHLCNRSLGGLGDTEHGVRQMLDYLIRAKQRSEDRYNELFHSARPPSDGI